MYPAFRENEELEFIPVKIIKIFTKLKILWKFFYSLSKILGLNMVLLREGKLIKKEHDEQLNVTTNSNMKWLILDQARARVGVRCRVKSKSE